MSDQNARDDAIVLAALPGDFPEIYANAEFQTGVYPFYLQRINACRRALRRLKRANLARYVRETKQWEKV